MIVIATEDRALVLERLHQEGGFRPPWGVLAFPLAPGVRVHPLHGPPGLELPVSRCCHPIAIGAVKGLMLTPQLTDPTLTNVLGSLSAS